MKYYKYDIFCEYDGFFFLEIKVLLFYLMRILMVMIKVMIISFKKVVI